MLAVLLLHTMSTKRRAAAKKRAAIEKCEEKVLKSVYCRTCLSTQNLVSIFYNSDTEEKMSRDLKLVTGLEIRINDGLSQKICTECLNIFNLTLQFRRKSKHAEKTLLSMVSGDVIGPKKGSIELDVPMYSKITRTKMEAEDFDYDDNMSNGNDFQMDDDFDCKDDVKPIMMKHQTPPPMLQGRTARQKTMKIPNASSYKCNTCSKEFRMKATYKAHMRFHTNYCVCEACGKRCRNNNQLQEHKRARHGLGRIHKCAYCEYSSATKEALTIHERRHTGERPYICDHCGASFHRRANLVQHIAIHLPEKNFQCTYCPTREKSKKRLQIHISKNHRVKRYRYSFKCPCCGKQFQRNEHTHRHLSRVHHIPRAAHPPIERVLLHGDKGAAHPPIERVLLHGDKGAAHPSIERVLLHGDKGAAHSPIERVLLHGDKGAAPPPASGPERAHTRVGNHFAPLLSNAM